MTTLDAPDSFATRLRAERTRLQLSQAEVAGRTRVARATQASYENAVHLPTIDYVPFLVDMGFDIAFVLFGVREARRVSQLFDWKRLSDIHSAIRSWCESKNVEITPQEEIDLGRALYDQFIFEEKLESEAVDRMLTLLIQSSNRFLRPI